MLKDQLNMLLKLQENDVMEDELNQKLRVISDKEEISIIKQTISGQEAALKTKCDNIDTITREIRSLDRKLHVLEEALKLTVDKMYGGDINTVKELSKLQKKQDDIKRRAENVEDNALKLMVEVENLRNSVTRDKTDIEHGKKEYEQKQLKKQGEIDRINKELDNVKVEKQNLINLIPAKLLDKYKKVKRLKRVAVAPLSEGKCSGCRMEVSIVLAQEVKRGESLVYCENCGRILV